MMNLFENLQTMNEITTKRETIDDYFDKLINEIQNKYNCDVDDTYYDIDNYPSEFKAKFVVYNIGLKQTDDIEKLIIKEISKDYSDVKVDYEFDNNYLDNFIKTAYVFEIRANNDINLWDTYNEELKLNENEELLEVKLSNEEGTLTSNDQIELNKIGEEVTNGINELIKNKNKLAKILPRYVDELNNEFDIKRFIGDEIDTRDWLFSEGISDIDGILFYENAMNYEIKQIFAGISGYTAQDLYNEYNKAKHSINYWMNKIKDIKEELKENDDVNNNSIEKYILDTNNIWNKIKEIKNEYDEAINNIWDLDRNHNWLFSVKLYDAINADNAEQDFEIYAEDTWNGWVDDVEDITGMNYDEVMQADNHNQSYFKFRDSFSILCNDSIDFSNFATLIETLSDENIIGNYYDADIETFIIDNKIDIDKFNEEFSDYDDKGLDYIRYLYNDLNDYVLSNLNIEIKQIKEIIHVYNSIKENQIKNIETYVNM